MNFKARVLIIDDRRSEVWFIDRVLQKEGFDTINAFDGLEGLQKVREEKPDLIILDTVMPKMDGYKVYHELKKDLDTARIPLLFLTDRGETYERCRIASAGRKATVGIRGRVEGSQVVGVSFLSKPVKAEDVVDRVGTLLQSNNLKASTVEVMDAKPRILIIDDDFSLVQVIKGTLQEEGLDVIIAFDGLEGLKKVREEKPDLIILDTIMPQVNGLQVLQYLRQHSKIPVIMIPGQSEADLLKEALFAGAESYVIKPFDPKYLLAFIRRKLRQCFQKRRWKSPTFS